MSMQPRKNAPVFLSLVMLAFEVLHLAYEFLHDGVVSHHLLNRADLPAISNWLGLVTLPLLGWAFGVRLRHQTTSSGGFGIPLTIWAGFVGSLLYGGGLALSFELDASSTTSTMALGLFVFAVLLPIYRAEYILGFVVGMTFTFGGVLPCLVAGVFATASVVLRFGFLAAATAVRRFLGSSGDGA